MGLLVGSLILAVIIPLWLTSTNKIIITTTTGNLLNYMIFIIMFRALIKVSFRKGKAITSIRLALFKAAPPPKIRFSSKHYPEMLPKVSTFNIP